MASDIISGALLNMRFLVRTTPQALGRILVSLRGLLHAASRNHPAACVPAVQGAPLPEMQRQQNAAAKHGMFASARPSSAAGWGHAREHPPFDFLAYFSTASSDATGIVSPYSCVMPVSTGLWQVGPGCPDLSPGFGGATSCWPLHPTPF